jgi:hypothetical protein
MMKNLITKRSKRALRLVTFCLLFCLSFNGWAQSENVETGKSISISTTADGKVKLKVTIKEGNDTKNFEKTYDSYDDIRGDPDLEKYGIELDDLHSFSRNFTFNKPTWGDDSDNFFMFDFGKDSLSDKMQSLMKNGFGGNNFFFNFGDDDPVMMDIDSLNKRINFNFGNGKMTFNDQELANIDSLRKAMKESFGSMSFKFDDDSAFSFHNFSGNDDDVKVISRARVIIRSAQTKDKEFAGTDKLEELEIKDLSFYPNPSDGRFNLEVETTKAGPLHVRIISLDGKVVYDKTDNSGLKNYDFKIDISDQEEGIYILKVIQNNKALTKRIIIE